MTDDSRCWPRVNWSQCDDDTGFPTVLPIFYLVSAIAFGMTGALYCMSLVRTLRMQLKEKKRLSYNTAVQMHVWIIMFSATGTLHHGALVMRNSVLTELPAQLLFHGMLLCSSYVTTVLVRHWLRLTQTMGSNGQTNDGVSRFIEIYRAGEVLEAVLMCSFFLVTIVYGAYHLDHWDIVQRLQCLVWASISGVTSFLVTVLGQRVYVSMRSISRSRKMRAHVRRVYLVAIGSSVLWCQCTFCFLFFGIFDSASVAAALWLVFNTGMNGTGLGVAALLYLVIGSKSAAQTAVTIAAENAAANTAVRVVDIQRKYREAKDLVLDGVSTLQKGVAAIASVREGTHGYSIETSESRRGYLHGEERSMSERFGSARRSWLPWGGGGGTVGEAGDEELRRSGAPEDSAGVPWKTTTSVSPIEMPLEDVDFDETMEDDAIADFEDAMQNRSGERFENRSEKQQAGGIHHGNTNGSKEWLDMSDFEDMERGSMHDDYCGDQDDPPLERGTRAPQEGKRTRDREGANEDTSPANNTRRHRRGRAQRESHEPERAERRESHRNRNGNKSDDSHRSSSLNDQNDSNSSASSSRSKRSGELREVTWSDDASSSEFGSFSSSDH